MTRTRIAAAACAAACAVALTLAPSAFASDPDDTIPCPDDSATQCSVGPEGVVIGDDDTKIVVDAHDGVRAGVKVDEVLCVRAELLTGRTTADARVRIPCHAPIRNCAEAAEHGYHDIPRGDERYRRYLDADRDGVACETDEGKPGPGPSTTPATSNTVPEAKAPTVVVADLPVTH